MAHYLTMPKNSQVLALLELGWSYRRIEAETGVRRETVSRYDQARLGNAAKTFPGSAPRLAAAGNSLTRLQQWAVAVAHRRGHNKATIALANNLARIVWAVWRYDVTFAAAPALAA